VLMKLQNVVSVADCDVDVNRPAVCDNTRHQMSTDVQLSSTKQPATDSRLWKT